MEIHFIKQDKPFIFYIDRNLRKLEVAWEGNSYQRERRSWLELFDKGKERFQHITSLKLNDEEFKLAIILEMAKRGYSLQQ